MYSALNCGYLSFILIFLNSSGQAAETLPDRCQIGQEKIKTEQPPQTVGQVSAGTSIFCSYV